MKSVKRNDVKVIMQSGMNDYHSFTLQRCLHNIELAFTFMFA